LGKLFDFGIALILALGLLALSGRLPTSNAIWLPGLVLIMMITALGLSLWLTALAIQFRDIAHGLGFFVQLLMYASPVIYPTNSLPTSLSISTTIHISPQWIYTINPMVGVIEGFRSALLGGSPMPWTWIMTGATSAVLILLSGLLFFRRREKVFADVA
jgi:lipopolysaccharide transport system permease protein